MSEPNLIKSGKNEIFIYQPERWSICNLIFRIVKEMESKNKEIISISHAAELNTDTQFVEYSVVVVTKPK